MDIARAALDHSEATDSPQTTASPAANANLTVFAEALDGEFTEAPFLIFRLGGFLFGVPALMVREIHALPMLSLLQETAPFIVGVINLRGAIVPVMDLNARFGRSTQSCSLDDSLIVLSWDGAEIAVMVNEVRVVQRISATQVEAPPLHGRARDLLTPFVVGVTQIESGIVMLLHLPHLLNWPASSGTAENAWPTAVLPTAVAAPRFDLQEWTPEERAVLEERAARLRAEAADNAQSKQERTPVALVALGGEEFGVELSAVREFVSVSSVAPVPCCPQHILGQINLRGDIVTLVDVRPTLGIALTTAFNLQGAGGHQTVSGHQGAQKTVPVVVVQHEDTPIGIVIDSVRDVLYLREDERLVLDANLHSGNKGKFFEGGTLHDGRLLPLLDVARLFAEGNLAVDEMA